MSTKTKVIVIFFIVFFLGGCSYVEEEITTLEPVDNFLFKEVSAQAGIKDYSGQTYGTAWGDFNSDGWPDLWLNNHGSQNQPNLYINQQDGTFIDIFPDLNLNKSDIDMHGAAWADFDNDGDQDLIQLVGSFRGRGQGNKYANQFYINNNQRFEEKAKDYGVDFPEARSRTPLWLDIENDGKLDLLNTLAYRSDRQALLKIFYQSDNIFKDSASLTGLDLDRSELSLYSDLTGDSRLDLLLLGSNPKLYDITFLPFQDITDNIKFIDFIKNPSDVVAADFNNDLLNDLFVTRTRMVSQLKEINDNKLNAQIELFNNEKGIQFKTIENISFNFEKTLKKYPDLKIMIGQEGVLKTEPEFTLTKANPDTNGIFSYNPEKDTGIYIGYIHTLKRWQVFVSSPEYLKVDFEIETLEPYKNLKTIGFSKKTVLERNLLFINKGNSFENETEQRGIDMFNLQGVSIAAADFDNDMDLDLYLEASGEIDN